jgi:hemerythrin superfamily protein
MAQVTTKLEAPIDMMILMHKAFRAQSERTEALAAEAQGGGDLGPLTEAFGFWMKQLLYHATIEDKVMTAPLTDCQPARDNESEHAELAAQGTGLVAFIEKGDAAGLEESVKAAMLSMEDEQHKELADKATEIESALKEALGESTVTARTRRHLYRRIMALRILEYDHFENEEAFVCSVVKERMSEQEQLEMVKHILTEEGADDPRWIIQWVSDEISSEEREWLAGLESRFSNGSGGGAQSSEQGERKPGFFQKLFGGSK